MTPIKIAINGLGRIGRLCLRSLWDDPDVQIVAANSPSSAKVYAHLIKYDSSYGKWDKQIEIRNDTDLVIDGRELKLFNQTDPVGLPWADLGVAVVIESTGVFRNRAESAKHLAAGAQRVIISAPAKDADATLLPGINLDTFDPANHHIISAASCTSNCIAPIVKILRRAIGIERGFLNTVHAYTNDQRLVDSPNGDQDLRRSRAAGQSIIPTKTGAAKTMEIIFPDLKGKFSGLAMRVPVILPSIAQLTFDVSRPTSAEEVNAIFQKAAAEELPGILDFSMEPLVSVDYKQNPHAAIVDGLSTEVIDNTMVNVVAWYDNEWGYVQQLVRLVKYIGK